MNGDERDGFGPDQVSKALARNGILKCAKDRPPAGHAA
jgi:hypothetical protein